MAEHRLDPRMPPLDHCVLRPLLERHVRERPDKECVSFENGPTWTYRELRARVAAVAAGLQSQGVRQGDHVLIWLPNGPEALLLWFAANWLGAVQVPLNTSYRGRILEHVLGIADAAVMVADAALLDRLRDVAMPPALKRIAVLGGAPRPFEGLEVIEAAEILRAEGEPDPPPRPTMPWDTQSMIYTSGTTGPSKGVLCSYMHYASSALAFPFVREGDRGLVTLPLFHMGGTGSVYRYLLRGASIVVAESFRTQAFWDTVRRHRITCASLLGAMTSFLVKAPRSPLDRDHTLRALTIVPLTEEAAVFRERFGVEVWTTFNMTEVACPIFSEANPTRVGSCGRPRPGITARIVDEDDCEVPVGAVGELALRSEAPWSMNHGYHRNPEATARAWRNGWFHTGDAFRRDAEGEFFFVDRMKDAIRRRGENISSFEVEAEICAHPAVREAAVVAVPSEFAEDEVLAVVAPVPGLAVEPRALVEFLTPRLPHFMVPRYFRFLPELPKTLTQKVEKHVLRAEGLTAGTWDREEAGVRLRRERLAAESSRTAGRGVMRMRKLLPLICLLFGTTAAQAQQFPERPPRLLAGFSAGGTLDIVARLMAEGMAPLLGQRVVVENRPGANGLIAAEAIARGPADGYALLVCPMGTMTISPQLPGAHLPIDPSKELVPVANMIAAQHAMVVAGNAPWRSVEELVAAARERPGAVSYATAGAGSGQQLSGAWLARMTGAQMTPVPYRGMAPAMPDIIAGRTGFAVTNIGDVAGQVASGDLRLLAVASAGGSPLYPGARFLGEIVPGFEVSGWIGLCGPRGLPEAAVARWAAAVRRALENPAVRARLHEGGMTPRFEDAAALAHTMQADREKWGRVIREADIRAD